ncbi:glycosyltransferase family 2 protein [Arthrobacter sp. Hiyo1]|uniref:glycosyltransferase family 2 protein n=1 Tax=Arthrobacter sp. Hiyo1 TaxID=1588020 RepID=UPI001558C7CE|nr:glycosyltransferase family 2 protein [Arthrobacter sp. Hiyo1]
MIAIVVAYKNGSELAECCQGLADLDDVDRVIIVDNSHGVAGSCLDASGLVLGPKMIHAIPPSNLGFAGGNNFGIELARELNAARVLICNPDVIVGPDTLSGLLREMDSRSLDLISPYMREVDRDNYPVDFMWPGWDFWLGRGVLDISLASRIRRYLPTFYGACFVIRVDLLDDIGGLCEDFFLYAEELDFCRRIDDSGGRWSVSKEYGVFHARGSSISPTGGPRKSLTSLHHSSRSAVIVGRKYWPLAALWWTVVRFGWAVKFLLKGNHLGFRAVILGVLSGWRAPLTAGSAKATRSSITTALRQLFRR